MRDGGIGQGRGTRQRGKEVNGHNKGFQLKKKPRHFTQASRSERNCGHEMQYRQKEAATKNSEKKRTRRTEGEKVQEGTNVAAPVSAESFSVFSFHFVHRCCPLFCSCAVGFPYRAFASIIHSGERLQGQYHIVRSLSQG